MVQLLLLVVCGTPARSSAEDDPKEGRVTGCSNCLISPQKAVSFTQEDTGSYLLISGGFMDFANLYKDF